MRGRAKACMKPAPRPLLLLRRAPWASWEGLAQPDRTEHRQKLGMREVRWASVGSRQWCGPFALTTSRRNPLQSTLLTPFLALIFFLNFFIFIFKKPRGTPAILCVSRVPAQGLLPLLAQTPNQDHPQSGAAEKYWAVPLGSRHSWPVQADALYPEPSCGTGAAAK